MMHLSNVSKMVHDKVTSNSGSQFQAMKFYCDGGLNALALNKDQSQVIVAGRSVFKILNMKEDGFSENTNLRLSKNRKTDLTFSTADVAWHPSDENIIASAATNGSVVIWNLNMAGKFKQDKTLEKHDRAVTRVLFHDSETHQLLSASQDGVVMIHDTRNGSSLKFGVGGNDSVRDAQFCPSSIGSTTFAAAYENGCVQIWDMRWPDRFERNFTAHYGPVFSLDWHPADKTWWLATTGRDRMIKVWDMVRVASSPQPPCLYNITNIAPVARIKWRPNRKHHISSCSMMVDHSINVWDVNRPYIPFAAFDGHKDVATSIVWRDDCHAFLSCGKDGYIFQHVFTDARRPADHMNLAGVDLSASGDIGYAFCEKKEQATSSLGRSKKVPKSRQFAQSSSGLCIFQTYQPHFDNMDNDDDGDALMLQFFVDIARSYKLDGSSLVDMCWHNGNVAFHFNKPQVAQFWRILATFFTPSLNSQSGINLTTSGLGLSNTLSEKHDLSDLGSKPVTKRSKEKEKRKGTTRNMNQTDSGSTEESSDHEGESSEVERSAPELNLNVHFLFGDGEGDEEELEGLEFSASRAMLAGEHYDWTLQQLPNEAFQPRHELIAMTGTHHHMMEDPHTAIVSVMDSLRLGEPEVHTPKAQSYESTLVVTHHHQPEPIDFSPSIAEMICWLAEQGDVQSAVSMLVVLGDSIRLHIDEAFQECWFLSYIDLLARFELWTVSNTVIKQSKLLGVCSLNQVSTMYYTQCPKCSKPCERAAWLCDKCKQVTNICSICHMPVKGLMAWCQGCGHGGHLEHIREWMEISPKCPAGCGHLCEYT